jgi:Family of unknown function (DUF5372)
VTHPFHPLAGRELELLEHRNTWDEDRVFYREESGRLRSLPTAWTSVVPEDPFVTLAAGRCPFRLQDLRALALLVEQIRLQRDGVIGEAE